MENDIFRTGAGLYTDPLLCDQERTLPEDTIPGWSIYLKIYRQSRDEDSRIFFFHALRLGCSPFSPVCFDIKREVTNTLWEIGDRSTIISEVVKQGVRELRVSITKWMVENDEVCRTLQRVLDYGLNNSI